MPLTEEQRRRITIKAGFDPDKFTARSNDEPDELLKDEGEPPASIPKTFLTGFQQVIGSSGGAFGAMSAAGSWLAPLNAFGPVGTAAHVVGTLGAGVLGGMAGGKIQKEIQEYGETPEETLLRKQKTAKILNDNPITGDIAQLALSALAFSPSPTMVANAAKGIGNLSIKALKGYAGKLPSEQISAIANLGVNAGAGAGMSIGSNILHNEEISIKDAAKEALLGAALFHEPTKLIGQKLLRFKSGLEPEKFSEDPITLSARDNPIGPSKPNKVIVDEATVPEIPIKDFLDRVKFADVEVQRADEQMAILEKLKQEAAIEKELQDRKNKLDELLFKNKNRLEVLNENPAEIPLKVAENSLKVEPDIAALESVDNTADLTMSNLEDAVKTALESDYVDNLGFNYQKKRAKAKVKVEEKQPLASPEFPTEEVVLPSEEYSQTLNPKVSQLLRKEGLADNIVVDANLKNEDINSPNFGKPVQGAASIKDQQISVNPKATEGINETVVHEAGHKVIDNLKKDPKSKKIVDRWTKVFGDEESLVSAIGKSGDARSIEPAGFKQFARDFKAAVKNYVKANEEDTARLGARQLFEQPSYNERVRLGDVKPINNAEDSEKKNQDVSVRPKLLNPDYYKNKTEWVSVKDLDIFKEYDRAKVKNEMSDTDINVLAKDLKENGIKEPLILEYSVKDKKVLLTEGNHRLAAAKIAGITELPVRVMRRNGGFEKNLGAKVRGKTPDEFGYVPGDMKPSDIGVMNYQDTTSSNPDDFTPAIKHIDGGIVSGTKGDFHSDIIDKQPIEYKVDYLSNKDKYEHGFVDSKGEFKSRSETSKLLGLNEELHSQKLAEMQRNKSSNYQDTSKQTETPEFKKWFGDSKVVAKDGKPLMVFHGTHNNEIDSFKENQHFGTKEQAQSRISQKGKYGDAWTKPSNTLPVFLNIKNPKRVKDAGNSALWKNEIERAKKEGYDGLVYSNEGEVGANGKIGYDSYAAFYPEQIKSAIGNNGEFNPNNPDIRYQDVTSKIKERIKNINIVPSFLKAENVKIANMGEDGKTIAKNVVNFWEKFDKYRGTLKDSFIAEFKDLAGIKWYNFKEQLFLENDATKTVGQYFRDLHYRGESDIILTPQEKKLVEFWKKHSKEIALKRNKSKGLHHNENLSENYFSFNISSKVAQTIFEKPASPESKKLINDWNEFYINHYRGLKKKWKSEKDMIDEAKQKARTDLNNLREGYNKTQINKAEQFGPLDENAGMGLPETWVEQNPIIAMSRYLERVSRRFAYNETIENNNDFKEAYADLKGNTSVKNVMNEIYGHRTLQEPLINSSMGAIRAGMMGTLTGTKDLMSAHILGMQHETPIQTIKSGFKAWFDIRNNFIESRKQGVNAENVTAFEMGDNENTASGILSKVRDVLSVVQARSLFEKTSRALSYGKGKVVAMDNIFNYSKNNISKQGEKFLNDFADDMDWKSNKSGEFTPDELATIGARYVRSIQGSYNYTGLPSISQQGTLSPYLSLSRWSIEKLNNYQKYVVEPAVKDGNFTPLLYSTLGMVIGGTAINELVELVNNKKSKAPTNNEIIQAFKDKDGHGISALTYKLATIASLSGYGGMMGDLFKSAMDWKFKNKPQTLNNVLVDGVVNFYDITKDFVEALTSNDTIAYSEVASRFLSDYLQLARIGINQLSDDKKAVNEKADKFRDLKMYKTLHGEDVSDITVSRPNTFIGADKRRFKQTDDIEEAKQLLPKIKSNIKQNAKDDRREEISDLKGLKINSYQVLPNPRINPEKFKKYISFIEKTQGKEAAKNLVDDYNRKNRLNRMKSGLVNFK